MIDPIEYFKFMACEGLKHFAYRLWWVLVSLLWAYWLSRWVSFPFMMFCFIPLAIHVGDFVGASQSVTLYPEKNLTYRKWWTIYTTAMWWVVIPYLAFQEANLFVRSELALFVPLNLYGTLITLTLRGVQHHASHKVKEWWPKGAPAVVRLHAQVHCGGHHRDAHVSQYWIVPLSAFLYYLTWELVTTAWWSSPFIMFYGWWGCVWCLALMIGSLNGAIMFEFGHASAHIGIWLVEQCFNTVWHAAHHRVGDFYAIFPPVDWPNVFFEKHIKGFIHFQADWMPAWWKRWCENWIQK